LWLLIHWIDLYYSSSDQIWVTFWSPFRQVMGDNWSWPSIGNEINLNHSWKKSQLLKTKFKQPILFVLGNNKWNVDSKFIFSFEVGGLCVEHLISITRGIEPNKKQKLDKKWTTFYYGTNIPFNVAWYRAFIKATKTTSKS
jgi:hypothetical protein